MNLREKLEKVTWLGLEHEAPILSENGLHHHFGGKDAVTPTCCCLHQIGGASIIQVTPENKTSLSERGESKPHADGMITSEVGVKLGIKSADCLPILLADKNREVILAIHAGWRGLLHGMLTQAITVYQSRGMIENLLVAIGPAIGPGRFEIGPEVVDIFIDNKHLGFDQTETHACLHKGKSDRWHLDLGMSAVIFFLRNKVPPENINIIRSCTFDFSEHWHSFRRDGEACGKNWSWISL